MIVSFFDAVVAVNLPHRATVTVTLHDPLLRTTMRPERRLHAPDTRHFLAPRDGVEMSTTGRTFLPACRVEVFHVTHGASADAVPTWREPMVAASSRTTSSLGPLDMGKSYWRTPASLSGADRTIRSAES